MRDLVIIFCLFCVIAICITGCGPGYDYGYGYPSYGYAPYWGGGFHGEPFFAMNRPWEAHGFGHPMGFYHAPVGGAGHFGGFHGGGFHGGGFHGGGGGHGR